MGRLSATWVVACLAACHTSLPESNLRYRAERSGDWQQAGVDQYAAVALGARCRVDLARADTRIHVVVENPTDSVLRVALGTESARSHPDAIGDCRLRPLDGQREPVHDYQPYRSLEGLEVESGWRLEFFLERPLGRAPTIGQYLVLLVELERGDERQFLQLPLMARGWSGTPR